AKYFTDYRNNNLAEFSVEELLKQLIYANAMGYEDHNDLVELAKDPAIAALGRNNPDGSDRKRKRDKG
ncbi:MAG: transposase, partial [Deltaproteobacteria bacterium]|nr:transposase [Deltaproteobacteria bacterium]